MRQTETSPSPFSTLFFLFVNTKSGNRQGQRIMDFSNDRRIEINPEIGLHFVDLFDNERRVTTINALRDTVKEQRCLVKVIICGGDGTINWVINELLKHQVDLSKCQFGVIPIGTGNDFCRTIGWPVKPFDFTPQNFTVQVKKWMGASVCKYDIWDVSIQTYKEGKIYDIKDRVSVERQQGLIKKAFANYVGVGIDARVSFAVQKIRTPFACVNLMLYGCIGFLNFLRPIKSLKRKIASFTENITSMHSFSSEDTVANLGEEELKSTKAIELDRKQNLMVSFKNKYKGLVCLNSNSYMAGLRNVWETKTVATDIPDKEFYPQATGDGKIEFVAFKNELSLGLQRIVRSGAKVTQGMGPFQLLFREREGESTYIQIDGESMKATKVKSIRICRSGSISGQQIKVMVEQSI